MRRDEKLAERSGVCGAQLRRGKRGDTQTHTHLHREKERERMRESEGEC